MKNKIILIILIALALICIPIVIIGIKDKRILPEKVFFKLLYFCIKTTQYPSSKNDTYPQKA